MPSRPASSKVENQFSGFGSKTMSFFRALAKNQDRDWFLANKETYEREIKAPMAALLDELSQRFRSDGIPLRADPRRSIMRIYRDIRFSSDKTPYKTHIAATMDRGGKGSPGMLYVHIGPKESFAAMGFYGLSPAELLTLRSQIVGKGKEWSKARGKLERANLPLVRSDALKRLPRGFDPAIDPALAEDLKLKNVYVHQKLAEEQWAGRQLLTTLYEFAEAGIPLLEFGWSAFDEQKKLQETEHRDR